ncbi:6-phosphogluconolactonase [Thermomonas hydrothermalis]|uniref:6-phosphogluconolactonase n=1 Tax=Thermomonas hydrothermalis TaxID=213588 RepID=A0A1M4WVS1_9GAMM|nr:6-phosphogluconolactonase [Thermomonas hydrothermalis]SHE85163.1 6-phosphogluconolactonase [Thermomonas hydrothermalis]
MLPASSPHTFHSYADADALATQLAQTLTAACHAAIDARGRAWLALAGGRTPLPVYARLAAAGLGPIEAIPTDERCVPHSDPACNLHQLRVALAGNPEITVHPLTCADGDPVRSLDLSRTWLARHPAPFDLVLLGMGNDGHIASLFPGAANLSEGLALERGTDVIASVPDPLPPEAPYPRISLTLARLLHARAIHLLATGQHKRQVLTQVLTDPQCHLPVAALLRAGTPIQIHWSP